MIRRRDRRDELAPRNYWGTLWSNPMTMLNDMDRIFDDFKTDWETLFVAPRTLSGELIRQPLVDISDEGKDFVLKAEIPGIGKDDLNIEVTENGIEISGESSSEKEEKDKETGFVRKERHYARFHRSLPFPDKIVPDKVDAQLKDGVLTVKAPKAALPEKKTQKVEVK
ncbi:MAG: Hsp20/alpha crystallin family protein [Methanobacteriota archaeon]|nr:MAG: Hsp20/alpha crystallin family protein [Euryarchaeota archaeon]